LLDVSRIIHGKFSLHIERIELAQVVAQAVETSRPNIEARKHELTVSLPPQPIRLNADFARLVQVLSNLLNNAAKYTPKGGRINLTIIREDREVVIRVRDTGIGIPVDMLGSVFEMFTQIDQHLNRSKGGLGIGLTLVKRLTEMHGGSAHVHSEGEGKGTREAGFDFHLVKPVEFENLRRILATGKAMPAETGVISADSSANMLATDELSGQRTAMFKQKDKTSTQPATEHRDERVSRIVHDLRGCLFGIEMAADVMDGTCFLSLSAQLTHQLPRLAHFHHQQFGHE
jgi:hypothetical protein